MTEHRLWARRQLAVSFLAALSIFGYLWLSNVRDEQRDTATQTAIDSLQAFGEAQRELAVTTQAGVDTILADAHRRSEVDSLNRVRVALTIRNELRRYYRAQARTLDSVQWALPTPPKRRGPQ